VKSGTPFSAALAQQKGIFPPIYSRLMEVGERTGSLETVLRQVATHMEKEQAIIKRVRGAMAYPAFMVLLAIAVVSILVTTRAPLMSIFEFDACCHCPRGYCLLSAPSRPHTNPPLAGLRRSSWCRVTRTPAGRAAGPGARELPLISAINIKAHIALAGHVDVARRPSSQRHHGPVIETTQNHGRTD
jgi:hypothetical protein